MPTEILSPNSSSTCTSTSISMQHNRNSANVKTFYWMTSSWWLFSTILLRMPGLWFSKLSVVSTSASVLSMILSLVYFLFSLLILNKPLTCSCFVLKYCMFYYSSMKFLMILRNSFGWLRALHLQMLKKKDLTQIVGILEPFQNFYVWSFMKYFWNSRVVNFV